ncbi:MAG: SDR family NAD(P)-dependent oxidoreductase [Burkholderiaceae bacterium]
MTENAREVVITGASSGFGAAAVRAFADRGDRVWGTLRDTSGRNAAKKAELEAHSSGITNVEMDVTSEASVADGFAGTLAEGPIDILINNAGTTYVGMTEAYSVRQAWEQMDTNYFGAIRTMQAVLPSMPTTRACAMRWLPSVSTWRWLSRARSPQTCSQQESHLHTKISSPPKAICETFPRRWLRALQTCWPAIRPQIRRWSWIPIWN